MSSHPGFSQGRRAHQATSGLSSVEKVLQRTLQPVGPRQAYISGLRARLDQELQIRRKRLRTIQYVLLSVAGFGATVMLIITSVRVALTILAFLGFLRLYIDRPRQPVKALK